MAPSRFSLSYRQWRWSPLALALAFINSVAAQTFTPSNSSDLLPEGKVSPLILGVTEGQTLSIASLIPAVEEALTDLPNPDGLTGSVRLPDPNNPDFTSTDITYISCDPSSYPSGDRVAEVFNIALDSDVTAVVLYSTTARFCNYTADRASEPPFPFVYSTTNQSVARIIYSELSSDDGRPPSAMIQLRSVVESMNNSTNGNGNGGDNNDENANDTFSSNSTTAVAMVILYSITGVITVLFLTIIISGAIRAHRHPERYGPTNAAGRPRQSRAKGIARAMLDTIPIVKFGENGRNKPTDVELAESRASQPAMAEGSVNQEQSSAGSAEDAASQPRAVEGNPGAVSVAPSAQPDGQQALDPPEDILGCPICTEDFEVGQDIRVLPCDHKFHPTCVDPWLLNVSGTCPLCRIDLRSPSQTDLSVDNSAALGTASSPSDARTFLAPPSTDHNANLAASGDSSRRHSFLSALHLRRMRDAPPAERIAAIRRFHDEQRRDAGSDDAGVESSRRKRLSARLADVFGGRARQRDSTHSQAVVTAAQVTDDRPEENRPATSPNEREGQREQVEQDRPVSNSEAAPNANVSRST